ncbi:N-alpha-acetyltransferase 80 isoform X1 [Aethina tumida]|uniref:N-alpha-acetyltransferase 80 isoform X1 n=1 Tax=Aethina tumida TaxID=116153 RepID=UPI00096AFB39|nr:N-alpha-acetyltransferase 80 isoform X1 [Aethina tumida]
MTIELLPLHHHPEYILDCCTLLNDEWKRSETARLRSLESSSDHLPTCLVLLQNKMLVGHVKLSRIPSIPEACFLESVVIRKCMRGQGYGTVLMQKTEDYCRDILKLITIYLSTQGQEKFYAKLGYIECYPVSIYGGCPGMPIIQTVSKGNYQSGPPPPPIPQTTKVNSSRKTYMTKSLI